MDNFAALLSAAVSLCFIFSGGWLLAKIRLPLRYLASGGLVAFGIFQLDSVLVHVPNDMARIVSSLAMVAVNISIIYFATIANRVINASPLDPRKVPTDRASRRREESSDGRFKPHDVVTDKNITHG